MTLAAPHRIGRPVTGCLSAAGALFAFRAAPVFRVVRVVIIRSVCRDRTAPTPIRQCSNVT